MTFKGLVIQVADSSYNSKSGRVERRTVTCLDAEPVKLKNTVDVMLPLEEFNKIAGDPNAQTLEFDVKDAEVFGGRLRLVSVVKPSKK